MKQVAIKYVPATTVIDSFTCLVIYDENGIRVAKTRGGKSSRSGLTVEPAWMEDCATIAYRTDAIPKDVDGEVLIVFDGHGTNPSGLRRVPTDTWNKYVSDWSDWRDGNGPMPNTSDKSDWAFYQAKRFTRKYYDCQQLTDGEADALSRYSDAEFLVYDKDTDGDVLEVIKVSSQCVVTYRWLYRGTDTGTWKAYALGTQTRNVSDDHYKYDYYIRDNLMVTLDRTNVYNNVRESSQAPSVFLTGPWHELQEGPWLPSEPEVLVALEELEDGTFVEVVES